MISETQLRKLSGRLLDTQKSLESALCELKINAGTFQAKDALAAMGVAQCAYCKTWVGGHQTCCEWCVGIDDSPNDE